MVERTNAIVIVVSQETGKIALVRDGKLRNVRGKKELPVQVDWIGKLPIYLTLTKVKIEPEKVTVIGGRSILEKISILYTEKVRLDTIENSGEITAKLALQPASLKISQGSKKRIKIAYEVKSKILEEVKEE